MSLVYLYLYCLLVQTISYRLVLYILSCTPKQLRKPKRYSRATMAQRHGNWQDRASKTGSESSIGVAVTNSQSYSYKTNMVVCSRLWVQGERKFTCHTVEITWHRSIIGVRKYCNLDRNPKLWFDFSIVTITWN